jgi:protocatechuate 3,4-dioxygenase beta subunit
MTSLIRAQAFLSQAGRCFTDANGWYRFVTIMPGRHPWEVRRDPWRPVHIHFSVMGRAVNQRLITPMYFPRAPCCVKIRSCKPLPKASRLSDQFLSDPACASVPDGDSWQSARALAPHFTPR